ncbi:hypothetical protein [Kitasatospora sp. NBC_00458]|uniref:hypothetical protein n=1 Tax=Kitasatospora sp. NBC_00458 TaxID=2903568 RepID=UPI002E174F84
MRAKHATKDLSSESRRPPGGRAGRTGRWLPRLPRAVAAGGALLAQLWGIGATGAYAASAEPLPEPVSRTAVGRALADGSLPDGTSAGQGAVTPGDAARNADRGTAPGPGEGVPDGPHPSPPEPPPVRPQDQPHSPAQQDGPGGAALPAAPPGLLGHLAGATAVVVPAAELDAATVGGTLQDRIRAGGLPLPGQRAAVPDAFAIASGLLGGVPAQSRPAGSRASREGAPDGPSTPPGRTGSGPRATRPGGEQRGPAAPPPARGATAAQPHATDRTGAGGAGENGRTGGERQRAVLPEGYAANGPAAVNAGAARTATVTAAHDASGTATAVLAPIAAGLALTGAAMYKHRGLPKGH